MQVTQVKPITDRIRENMEKERKKEAEKKK